MPVSMKSANIPSLRVDPRLRSAAEDSLEDGETLSHFVEQSIREAIERRTAQRAFVARGLGSRDIAKHTGKYVSSEKVLGRLDRMLTNVKAKAKGKAKTTGRA